jgi:DNA-binding SARP family transcriptional activator/tetratricopeptide (TPR) repeat protein
LGSVDVVADGIAREVPGLRRKAVLAALAVRPGEIVSTDQVVDAVWGDHPPGNTAATLQNHISRLRGLLDNQAAIVARAPGYLLRLGAETTDVQAAQRLIDMAGECADPADRERLLRDAVSLWRGPPLADVAGPAGLIWFDQHVQRLNQLGLHARINLADTRLLLGQHSQLIPELEELAATHPWNEQIHGQLMLALYRAGRQSDALAVFRRLREALGAELGVHPGAQLRELETAILRHDPTLRVQALAMPEPAAAVSTLSKRTSPTVPMQLPATIGSFTGRTQELANLDRCVSASPRTSTSDTAPDTCPARQGAVPIITICGSAGIGKTTLAAHWAHRVEHQFPDGQLYVNLRGFDPNGQAVEPGAAIRGFLDAFGIPGDAIPPGLDAQIALFRGLLAGKRILVVLDNARDVEQVRPLLPVSPGCLAIVTSRNRLTPLVVTEGAHPLTLDVLTADEARGLLIHRLGVKRIDAEPDAVDEIIARCAQLPLALAIVAARAATHPNFTLTAVAAELHEGAYGLDALDGGDAATDVRSVFSGSYQTLSAGAARMFRLLSLHPGPDIGASAAASLAGLPYSESRARLAELTRAHLVTEHAPGRYTFHDLLRGYAAEQSNRHDDPNTRRTAVQRVLDYYLHTASRAQLLISPHWDSIDLAPTQPGAVPEMLNTKDAALDWFTAERQVLLAAVERAAETGFDTHAWQLPWLLSSFLFRQARWPELVAVQRTALRIARCVGNQAGQANALKDLGLAACRSGQLDDADTLLRQALRVHADLGHLTGQAHTHLCLSELASTQNCPADVLTHARKALDLFRAAGNTAGQAMARNGIGYGYALLSDQRQAIAQCTQALTLLQEIGEYQAAADTWDSLGYAYRGLAKYDQSADCYQHAINLYRELGAPYFEGGALVELGNTYEAAGRLHNARAAWQEALDIFDRLAVPDTDEVHAKLHR